MFFIIVYIILVLKNKKKICWKNKGEPILYKNGIGQYDTDNKLIKEFVSKFDWERKLGISDESINKALEKNISYANNYFKRLPEKIKCFD